MFAVQTSGAVGTAMEISSFIQSSSSAILVEADVSSDFKTGTGHFKMLNVTHQIQQRARCMQQPPLSSASS
jgi:hypothetical protein